MSSGLVRGWCLKLLFRLEGGEGAQFQCRLFLWVQALILGARACSLVVSFEFCVVCLGAWLGFCLVVLGRIIVACGMLAGKNVVMDLLLGLGKHRILSSWSLFWGVFGYPAGSGRMLLTGWFAAEILFR